MDKELVKILAICYFQLFIYSLSSLELALEHYNFEFRLAPIGGIFLKFELTSSIVQALSLVVIKYGLVCDTTNESLFSLEFWRKDLGDALFIFVFTLFNSIHLLLKHLVKGLHRPSRSFATSLLY